MIELESVTKTFQDGTTAVDSLNMTVAEGETVVLLGTSGSGKTTTMKMINRLIEPSSGSIRINDKETSGYNPVELRRTIGYSIQHIGLFPHMTIGDNIAVVPRLLKWDSKKLRERTDELLELVSLDPEEFRDRYPAQLSGGQRQRIGVARALAADPPIILMDEPFGALDPITREQLQDEFLELESEIRKTIIFVTHDVFEAVKMGDRIALLDQGRLQQLAEPADLVDHPANEFVDQFLGSHRFQLSLLTQTLSNVDLEPMTEEEKARGEYVLSAEHPLINALDMFKKSGESKLPVRKKGRPVGMLTKKRLLSEIASVFGEMEREESA